MAVEVTGPAASATAEADKIDFFISRTGSDKDIAVLIARILRDAGYKTLLQDDDFGHASFMAMMAKGWSSGARLVCLLSGDYQKSEYCKKEYEVALTQIHDPRNLKQQVIVLRIAECDPIEHLADLAYTDLMPVLYDATAFARAVRGAVGATKDRVEIDFAALCRRAPKQIVHPSIEENPNFAGREEDLARLNAALSAGRTAALTNSGHAATLSGLGGVGKSVLAREFAWRNKGRYQGIWWVRAEKRETLFEDLIEPGSHFIPGLQGAEDRPKAARAALDHIWQGTFQLPWLIVYDNVEKPGDLEHLTPRGGAHILITSRWPHWDEAAEIAIDVFPRDVAIQYLMKRARKNDPEGAGRLAEALGYLPLALDHAGSYLRNGFGTFDGYIRDLAEFLKRKPGKGKSRGQYPDSVHGTFNLALDRVIAGDPDLGITAIPEAEQLMRVLAFLAPDQIPLDFIPPEVLPDIQKGDAAAALQEASLLRIGTFEDGRPHASVHRLVQQVMRGRLEDAEELDQAAARATELVGQAFAQTGDETMRSLTIKDRLLPHALTVLGHAPLEGSVAAWTGYLSNQTGDWQLVRGDAKGALANYQKSHVIREKLAAADPGNARWQRDVALSHGRVAMVLARQGSVSEAAAGFQMGRDIIAGLRQQSPDNAIGVTLQKTGT